MRRAALPLVLIAWLSSACGGPEKIEQRTKADELRESRAANPSEVDKFAPGLEVGAGPLHDAVESALRNAKVADAANVVVKLDGVPPPNGSGTYTVTATVDAKWLSLPNLERYRETRTLDATYENLKDAPTALGATLAKQIVAALEKAQIRAAKIPAEVGPARAVAVGSQLSCALLEDRSVRCWGHGSPKAKNHLVVAVPSRVPIGPAIAIAAGDGEACAIVERGEIQCWGGRFVDGESEVVARGCGVEGATAIAVTNDDVCAIVGAGEASKLVCGALEKGPFAKDAASCKGAAFHTMPRLTAVTAIASDHFEFAALGRLDGAPQGATPTAKGPRVVVFSKCRAEACEPTDTGIDGAVAVSGSAYGGFLDEAGLYTKISDRSKRVQLAPKARVVATGSFACALSSGALDCWGEPPGHYVDERTLESRWDNPKRVAGLADVSDVSLDLEKICAIAKGEVMCWGTDDETNAPLANPRKVKLY